MMLGMSLAAFTLLHVAISLIGIATGFVVLFGLIAGRRLDNWTVVFLATTVLTSVTGFGFPFVELLPSHIVGAISLVVLALAILARYQFGMAGAWRRVYTICASIALYFNVFVLVVQSFQKVPVLKGLAPTQSEAPFVIAQVIVLVALGIIGRRATVNFQATPDGVS